MNSFDGTDEAARNRAILDERAQLLARPPAGDTPSQTVELLYFELSRERYAIETSFVRRIARLPKVCPIPGVPDHFKGAINLHGEIVPIVDLRSLLKTSAGESAESQHIVVLGRDRAEFGVIVDVADEINTLGIEVFERSTSSHADQPFVRTILSDALIILDGALLLDDPRLLTVQSASRASSLETTK